jgi:hypothetical protein
MIQDNTVSIIGWIQYEKVKWLQNNNPEVPGLVYKLAPMDEKMRKLGKVRKLWEGILEIQEIRDIFTGEPVQSKKYDIDHFIPWSYVASDELWNLIPTEKSINSSKSNNLPDWDVYFGRLAKAEYDAYSLLWSDDRAKKLFDKCAKENLNNEEVRYRLYQQGQSEQHFTNQLEGLLLPIYESARNMGFRKWTYTK